MMLIKSVASEEKKPQIITHYKPLDDLMNFNEYPIHIEAALSMLGVIDKKSEISAYIIENITQINRVVTYLREILKKKYISVIALGSIEERILILYRETYESVVLSLGIPIKDINLPIENKLKIYSDKSRYVASMQLNKKNIMEITEPRVVLCGLYLEEMFPLPRFALGISDIARALRRAHVSNVKILDMQLGLGVSDLVSYALEYKPTIIGVSVTFGQQKKLSEFMEEINKIENDKPVIVLGGSLCALNKNELLDKYPNVIIGLGSGEKTMVDVVNYFKGKITLDKISGIAYKENNKIYQTGNVSNRLSRDMLPELDLLNETLNKNGVMLLESSRGCSYACSFCPREHKGIWAGDSGKSLENILPFISREFDKNSELERKIYLVDEEMFGYNELSDSRVIELSELMNRYDFKFETSSRVDQVYRPRNSQSWHVTRLKTWMKISDLGMERCLFGVESGVDSILKRFNKKTTCEQNVKAIQILSAADIKIRCTYITFDNLMNFKELINTYEFLGRKDVLLKPFLNKSSEHIIELVLQNKISEHEYKKTPLYYDVSYLLVSMESLKGSKYAEMTKQLGLVVGENMTMGRYDCKYQDPIVGIFSEHCQMWIDRNFPLDYTLKSIQKYCGYIDRNIITELRHLLKRYSYDLLGKMIFLETGDVKYILENLDCKSKKEMESIRKKSLFSEGIESEKSKILKEVMSLHFNTLVTEFSNKTNKLSKQMTDKNIRIIENQISKWKYSSEWELYYG